MSTPITPQQMIQSVLDALNESVKDIPEDMREEVKAKILDNFWAAIFKGPVEARIPKPLPPVIANTVLNKCTVCGLEGLSGVVCYHPRCPTRVTCT